MAQFFPAAFLPALDDTGASISGATLTFYLSGTSTPKAVYTSPSLNVSLGNVVTADSAGRFPDIWLDTASAYKVVLKNAAGTTLKTVDQVNIADGAANVSIVEQTFTGNGSTTAYTVTGVYETNPSNFLVHIDGVYQPISGSYALSLSGANTVVTFTSAPPSGSVILIRAYSVSALGDAGPPATITWKYSTTTTDADPGAGYFRLNNATIASATQMFISETSFFGSANVAAWIQSWDDSTNTTTKGILTIRSIGALGYFGIFKVTGSVTDAGSYDKVTITHVSSSGTWTADDEMSVDFSPAGEQSTDARIPTVTAAGNAMIAAASAAAQTALLDVFVGDSGSGGTKGLVLAPGAGDAAKFLRGDRSWQSVGAGVNATTGSVTMTAASLPLQNVTTTAFGSSVTLPDATTIPNGTAYRIKNAGDYPLQILDNAGGCRGFVNAGGDINIAVTSIGTAAGTWTVQAAQASDYSLSGVTTQTKVSSSNTSTISGCWPVVIDANRTMIFLATTTATTYLAIVHDSSTNTFGAAATVTFAGAAVAATGGPHAVLYSSNTVLVGALQGASTISAVAITVSGTTITAVGTAASGSVGSNAAVPMRAAMVNGSAVFLHCAVSGGARLVAATVSGTTVTWGSPSALSVAMSNTVGAFLTAAGSNALIGFINGTPNAVVVELWSVSGTTITSLSTASRTATSAAHLKFLPLSDGRFFITWTNSSWSASIVSISGSTVSIATPVTSANMETANAQTYGTIPVAKADASKIVVAGYRGSTATANFEVITNTGGTPSIGTTLTRFFPLQCNLTGMWACSVDNANKVCFVASVGSTSNAALFQWFEIDISGASPTLSKETHLQGDTTFVTQFTFNTEADARRFPFDANTAQNATTGAVVRFAAAIGQTRTPWGVVASSTGLRKAYVQPENAQYGPTSSATMVAYSGTDFWLQARDSAASANEIYVSRVRVSI